MKKSSILIMIMLIIAMTVGCTAKQHDKKESSRINVVATTTMLNDLVKQIGGESVEVVGLMGPGIDPHLYKASAGDVTKMQKADMVVYNGIHLEGKMGDLFKNLKNKGKVTVAVGDVIDKNMLISSSEFEGNYDPHIWFDINIWMDVTNTVTDQLIKVDKQNEKKYIKNRDEYLKKLKELDSYIKNRVEELDENSRILVTAHDAFNYFGKAYGFNVRGLQGISTEAEAGTKDVSTLADFIVEKKIKAIFIETSVPVRNVKALQEAVLSRGFEVKIGGELFSDSTGTIGTPEGTLIGTVKHNIDTIINALK
ncbi:zinc ABC transporter substrate-binding protein [Clostridiaceae bacterium M8S5]|nr:zinc ABC transporter substrate-binding protein [Clostridiaceae bacterium M8S5]